MSNGNDTTQFAQVQTMRAMIQPIEDHAAEHHIEFDTIVRPARHPSPYRTLELSVTIKARIESMEDFNQPEVAHAYAEFCEGYAARLAELAKSLRQKFPATVPAGK